MNYESKLRIDLWYQTNYSNDELGCELNEVTFHELFEAMDRYKDVYDFLGVEDSIIRERVFEKLAEIMEVDYDYIYDQWLLSVD